MAKTSKKKSYTEDVVLNKIFKDISEENLKDPSKSSDEPTKQNTYEDDLVKLYRKRDVEERRQRYINIVKIITILFVLIFLIFVFTNYIDSIADEPTQVKKTVISVPITQEKISKPVQVKAIKIEQKEIIHFKPEPKKVMPAPIKEPIKKVKTERELAKENLFQQMNN